MMEMYGRSRPRYKGMAVEGLNTNKGDINVVY